MAATQQPIQNRLVVIVGKPGSGKTLLASYLMQHYGRQYANFSVYPPKSQKPRNGIIRSIEEANRIKFSPNKGVLAMDETGINLNSRRSSSEENIEGGKLPMLGRKKNIDIIAIGQLLYSIDKYYRDLASIIISMRSFWECGKLKFEATVYRGGSDLRPSDIINVWEFDLIFWANWTGIRYDTLETSIIRKNVHFEKSIAWKMMAALESGKPEEWPL